MSYEYRKEKETRDKRQREGEREREDQVRLPGHNTINWGRVQSRARYQQNRREENKPTRKGY